MGRFQTLRQNVREGEPHVFREKLDEVREAFADEILPLYLQGEWRIATRPLILPDTGYPGTNAGVLPRLRFDPNEYPNASATSTYDHLICFRMNGKKGAASFRTTVAVAHPYTNLGLISLNPDWHVLALHEANHDFFWPGTARGYLIAHRMHLRPEIAQAA